MAFFWNNQRRSISQPKKDFMEGGSSYNGSLMNEKFIQAVIWAATNVKYVGIRLTKTGRLTTKPSYGDVFQIMQHYNDLPTDVNSYFPDKNRNDQYDQLMAAKGIKAEIKRRLTELRANGTY